MLNQITGTPIIQSKWVPETIWVKRTWKERLFSLPWKPFQKTRETPGVYVVGGVIYCHPKRYDEIVSELTSRALDSLKDGEKKPEFVIFDDIHDAGE